MQRLEMSKLNIYSNERRYCKGLDIRRILDAHVKPLDILHNVIIIKVKIIITQA